MVSRIIKKTPTKSIKDCRSRRRKRSPLKNNVAAASSLVIASINKSIFTCHRRLIKIFSKLTRISNTPNRRKGYQILKNKAEEDASDGPRKTLVFGNHLPPLELPEKGTIFLDLDETLVHSQSGLPPKKYDFIVRPTIDGEVMNFYVLKRPGVDELLEKLGEKFEIVVFTAGLREYASLVLDRLDKKGMISHRLYRDSCKEIDGKFVKDLSDLGRDLKRVVIVDDNPNAYFLQPENAIPMPPFIDDLADGELENLVEFFEGCDSFKDMRDAVKHYQAKGSYKQSDIWWDEEVVFLF